MGGHVVGRVVAIRSRTSPLFVPSKAVVEWGVSFYADVALQKKDFLI